jgi:hypothetical protein
MPVRYWTIDPTNTTAEWYTPRYIFDALGCRFDLDPASPGADVVAWVPADRFYTREGLQREWTRYVWMNPPYGRKILPQWVKKFIKHRNGILLVPEHTSTRWWQRRSNHADLILCVYKKISFVTPTGKTKDAQAIGSTLVAIGEKGIAALENAGNLGRLLKPIPEAKVAA